MPRSARWRPSTPWRTGAPRTRRDRRPRALRRTSRAPRRAAPLDAGHEAASPARTRPKGRRGAHDAQAARLQGASAMSSGRVPTAKREREPSRREAPRRTLSIRATVHTWTAVFGVPALLVLAWLVATSALLTNAIHEVIRDSESMSVADEIQVLLLGQHRLSALHTDGTAVRAERARLASATDALLDRARLLAASERERELIEEVDAHATTYRIERARAEARGLPETEIRRRVQPILERALRAATELRALNAAAVTRAQRASVRIDELGHAAGIGAGLLLLGGFVALILGARHYVIRPLENVHASLLRFRAGDLSMRLEPSGPRELRDIARALNDHVETIAKHREARLTFIAGVAHELRNPLAALRMSIDLAKADRSEPTRARVFETVDRQVARLERMIGDLLDATRIEAGQLVLRRERLDLREAAREAVSLYETSAPRHRFALQTPEHPVLVHADPLRIEQVVNNLVSNAVKYAPRGGRVDVTVSEGSSEAILAVRDEGIGIAPEAMADLFAPYRRLSTDVAPGAGLGLAVARRIVQAHGGRIEVESIVGRGSTFRVHLPLAARSAPAPEPGKARAGVHSPAA